MGGVEPMEANRRGLSPSMQLSPRALRIGYLLYFPAMYLFAGVLLGIAALPSALFLFGAWNWVWPRAWPPPLALLALTVSVAWAYFLFGFVLLFVLAGTRAVMRLKGREGSIPVMSLEAATFASYNGLLMAARLTILPWFRNGPLLPLFYRLMGARIGKNVLINTTVVHDCDLLDIGDGAVLGGDACIICHSAEGGRLHRKRVSIGKGATIGQYATILSGVRIGDGAIVGANSVVPKDTVIPPNEVWGGVPAKRIGSRDEQRPL